MDLADEGVEDEPPAVVERLGAAAGEAEGGVIEVHAHRPRPPSGLGAARGRLPSGSLHQPDRRQMSLTSRHPLRVKYSTATASSYMGHATRTVALSDELGVGGVPVTRPGGR